MNLYYEAERFVGFTEIRNVFMRIPIKDIPECSDYLTIDDQIVCNYEKALNMITTLKRSKYNKMKLEQKLNVINTINITNKNEEYYIKLLNNVDMNNTTAQLDVNNAIYDETHTSQIEKETTKYIEDYLHYVNTIQYFLKTIHFFYIDSKHVLTRETLMTSAKYQTYLKELFEEIVSLAIGVSNSRMNDKKYHDSIGLKLHKNNMMFNTKYFQIFYEFTDDNIIRDKQQLLKKLVTLLFVLIKNIKNTHSFLNNIIHIYHFNNQKDTKTTYFINKLLTKRVEYIEQRIANRELLPTSWFEYMFYPRKTVKGKNKYLLEDYFRYMCFWFEQNKITNEYEKFLEEMKDCQTNQIDYVSFIFGLNLTNTLEYNKNDITLYKKIYNKKEVQTSDNDKIDTDLSSQCLLLNQQ
jgi:hypothetical protein